MSLLDAYTGLMEDVMLGTKTSVDHYNDPIFSTSSISVIWWDDVRVLHQGTKEEVQQMAIVQSVSEIKKDDRITRDDVDYPVVEVQIGKNFDGTQFYIANLGDRLI